MKIKTLLVKITLVAIIGLFTQTTLFAKVYKWVDENGQINYGDQPENANAQRMEDIKTHNNKPTVADNTEAKENSAVEKNAQTEKPAKESAEELEKESEKKPEKIEKPKISKKEKRRLCKEGRDDYKKISSRGRMREISKKGEYTYLSEEQRQKRLAAAKKKQRKYCH